VIKNLRVTQTALEFDLYALDSEKKQATIAKLEHDFGKKVSELDLEIAEEELDKIEVLKRAVELFNEQRYWECHETLEQIWRKEPRGPEKDVQQGIILAASALVHFQKNEDLVCLGMIPSALAKLNSWHENDYYMVNVAQLKVHLEEIRSAKVICPFKILTS
jgi:hypothetical protein